MGLIDTWLANPVRVYKPSLDRNLIGKEKANRTILNLINGKIYSRSGWNGINILYIYFRKFVLAKSNHSYKTTTGYKNGHFSLANLEDLGATGKSSKKDMYSRGSLYLDLAFKGPTKLLNLSPTAVRSYL